MVRPGVWIEDGLVEVGDGRVLSVGKARKGAQAVDHGPGVIMPALVNAHAHLSLSALQGRVDAGSGFVNWVRGVIRARADVSADDMARAAHGAVADVARTGTGLIAEVGPVEPGASAIARAGLEGIVLSESLGNDAVVVPLPADGNGLRFSYAGHALHTTSPEVLRALKAAATERNGIFSIHLAESEAETEFLASGEGPWAELLESRNIPFRDWDLRTERPVARAERIGLLGPKTLAVHLLEVTDAEVTTLAESGTTVCVCPRSNLALHGRLPKIEAFLASGLTVALGTDSLASVPSLDMFDEMAFVTGRYPGLPPEAILGMAGINAAGALGMPGLGSIEPGQRARLIYVAIEAQSEASAAAKLVSKEFGQVKWL
ncbi:MAG: amidohydrolase family protein [Desulfomonile tiedjei]|nr:amidohydrolase family protein [Desulfomonile tiedjei]